jgi:hypothetical protein
MGASASLEIEEDEKKRINAEEEEVEEDVFNNLQRLSH